MSHSDSNTQQWHQLLAMYFSLKLTPSEAIAWFMELRRTTKGWRYDSATEGRDACQGERARKINGELCDCIRYIKDLDKIPRKAEAGKDSGYKGKPNVNDLGLWIWIWRKSVSKKTGEGIHQRFVEVCCENIQRLVDEGRRLDAALLSVDPINIEDCRDVIMDVGGNRSYSEPEADEVRKFCGDIGLSPNKEFDIFYEQSTGKKAVSQYASTLSDQWQDEDDKDMFQ